MKLTTTHLIFLSLLFSLLVCPTVATAETNRHTGAQLRLPKNLEASSEAEAAAGSKVSKSDLIEAEVTDILSPNEIEVNMQGKQEVIKLSGVKDCPCDFNEQATKLAHAETKASKGFTEVDAGTIVTRCREIRDTLSGSVADDVLVKLAGSHRDSSGRLSGVIWNKGKTKSLNETVQSYAQKQSAKEKKKKQHRSHKKAKQKEQ